MRKLTFRAYPLILAVTAMALASALAVEYTTIIFGSVLASPFILVSCLVWPSGLHFRHWLFHNAVVVPFALAAAISIPATHWPLRLHYIYAKPEMESLAAKVETCNSIDLPVRVGLLRIQDTELRSDGTVCLWVDPSPGGPAGFVKTSPEGAEKGFNLWSMVNLDRRWQFIKED